MVGRVHSVLTGFLTTAASFALMATTACSAAPDGGNVDNVTATAADRTHAESFAILNQCIPIKACGSGQNCGTIPDGCGGTVSCSTVDHNADGTTTTLKPDGHLAAACSNSPMDGVCIQNVCTQTKCSTDGYFPVYALRHVNPINIVDHDAYTRAFPNTLNGDAELLAYEQRVYGISSANGYEYLIDNVITPCAKNPQGEECRTAASAQIYLVGIMDSAYSGYDMKAPDGWGAARSPWNPGIPTTKPPESGLLTTGEWNQLLAITTDPKNKFPNSPATAAGNSINSYYKECVVVFAKETNTPLNWYSAVEVHDPRGPNW